MKKIQTPNYEITAYYIMQEGGVQIQVNATAHYSDDFMNIARFIPMEKESVKRIKKEMDDLARWVRGRVG